MADSAKGYHAFGQKRNSSDRAQAQALWRERNAVLIFDLAKVNDAATYEKPHQLAEGMNDIIVNGELVRRDGKFTGTLPGRVLRPERR